MTATVELDYDNMSIMERIALLPSDEQARLIGDFTVDDLTDPEMWLRGDQLEALHDDAAVIGILAGRGAGKTRTGSSWAIEKAKSEPGSIGHLVARTVADCRDVMVQGESGILAISPDSFMPEYTPSLRRLDWPNGSHALTFSSEEPSQLRGPQSHWTWGDELAAWNHRPDSSGATAWDNVRIGTRLGPHPQILVTTTPKRIAAIRDLVREAATARVSLHGASTLANRAHLAPSYLQNLFDMYAGTALERQELYGELLDIVEAALWQPTDIRYGGPDWLYGETISVIGVDPGLTTGGDATGIVTTRATNETALTIRKALVVADWTEDGLQPERWAARVVEAWRTERDLTGNIPIIAAEKNAGGEMIATTIESVAGENALPIALIPAKPSKAARAEPIVVAYRKDRIRHMDEFVELVEEQTTWEPPVPGVSRGSGWSPNRMDAMVTAMRCQIVDDKPLKRFGKLGVSETSEVLHVPTARWRNPDKALRPRLPWRDEPGSEF